MQMPYRELTHIALEWALNHAIGSPYDDIQDLPLSKPHPEELVVSRELKKHRIHKLIQDHIDAHPLTVFKGYHYAPLNERWEIHNGFHTVIKPENLIIKHEKMLTGVFLAIIKRSLGEVVEVPDEIAVLWKLSCNITK